MAQIQAVGAAGSLFLFSPLVDGPPRYRSLFPEREQQNLLGISAATGGSHRGIFVWRRTIAS